MDESIIAAVKRNMPQTESRYLNAYVNQANRYGLAPEECGC